VFSTGFQVLFLAIVAALFLGALVRQRRTPESHPDFRARGDMTRLLFVFLIGQGIILARSRFPATSQGFWLCSAALLPVVIIVVTLVLRLFNAYRHPNETRSTKKP
jgi:hypothetical protein